MINSDKHLFSVTLEDCRVECIASTHGAGGQNRNRRHTAVRITHEDSGAIGYSADERSQLQNKTKAFRRMAEAPSFRAWVRLEAARLAGKPSIDEQVDRWMDQENLLVEVRNSEGRWEKLA